MVVAAKPHYRSDCSVLLPLHQLVPQFGRLLNHRHREIVARYVLQFNRPVRTEAADRVHAGLTGSAVEDETDTGHANRLLYHMPSL